ncbi:MAG: ribonuclease P protein component [Christensenellaceae bacterium]|jgi:ribonuclease P protein component
MPALNTLKKNKEFGFVHRKGKNMATGDLVLIVAKSRYGGVRAGFSVSKKVGNSVVRNKARRRLKEALRLCLPYTSGNYSIIFIARPTIKDAAFSQIKKQMEYLLKKAGVLSDVCPKDPDSQRFT